jgi:hypothetical protein
MRFGSLWPRDLGFMLLLGAVVGAGAATADWRPVDPTELAQAAPVVDKSADAEALAWEVRIDHRHDAAPHYEDVREYYLRIKIFTARGAEAQGTVEIPPDEYAHVTDVSARTIRPDGSVIEVKKDAILQRTLVRERKKLIATSFVLSDVQPGAIVEYKWRESRAGFWVSFAVPLQLDIPVRTLRFAIRPYPNASILWSLASVPGPVSLTLDAFRLTLPPWKHEGGFETVTLKNLPANRTEPYMPPEYENLGWIQVQYTKHTEQKPAEFWRDFGRRLQGETRHQMAADDAIRATASRVVGDAATDAEKLERLYRFCQREIKRTDDDATPLTPEEREELEHQTSARQVLEKKAGTSHTIDLLFAALASAAGFQARVAASVDRRYHFFDESLLDAYLLDRFAVAIRQGSGWRFFSPGTEYMPPGMLSWRSEGEKMLVADPDQPVFVMAPVAAPDASRTTRQGQFKLSEEGTLEGDVRVEYTGQTGAVEKERYDEQSPAERTDTLVKRLKNASEAAAVENVRFEGMEDPDKPLVLSYHVRIPGFADRTGHRLFLSPGYFQYGERPLFPASERGHDVFFRHAWSEEDKVTIELPSGFELDRGDTPPPLTAGTVGEYKVTIGVATAPAAIVYTRTFTFGGGGAILFPVDRYAILKGLFDAVQQSDQHKISLRPVSASRP